MNQERNLCLLLITLHYQGWTKLRQWQTQSGWRVTWRNNLEKHAGNFTVKRWSPWRQEPITCENPPIQFDLVPIPKISGWLFSCPWCLSRKSPGFAFYCFLLQVKVGILIFIQNEICSYLTIFGFAVALQSCGKMVKKGWHIYPPKLEKMLSLNELCFNLFYATNVGYRNVHVQYCSQSVLRQ